MSYAPHFADEHLDRLVKVLTGIDNEELCYRFLEDLCTINELQAMAQRLEVARMLSSGMKYHEIAEKTGASTATISRINKCLEYGAEGYSTIIKRLEGK